MNTNPEKVLITGATGFLGKNLSKRLVELGYQVYGIGRNLKVGKELELLGVQFLQIDILDKDLLIESTKNMDYVVHCAAKSSLWGRWDDFYNTNVVGTKNVIEAVKINNIKRLIHISSPSIYFEFKDKFDIKEDDVLPKKMVNFYAQTKYLAELEADKAFKEGVDVITIRPRAIWGVGDTSIIPRLIAANNKRFIPRTSDSPLHIDITHVDNVVQSIICSINASKSCSGKKYNITNGEPIELYSFMEKTIVALGYKYRQKRLPYQLLYFLAYIEELKNKILTPDREPLFTRYSLGLISFNQTLNIENAINELGYKPIKTNEEGLKEYIEINKE